MRSLPEEVLVHEHKSVVAGHLMGERAVVVLVPKALAATGKEPLVADQALVVLVLEVVAFDGPPAGGGFLSEVGGRRGHEPPPFPMAEGRREPAEPCGPGADLARSMGPEEANTSPPVARCAAADTKGVGLRCSTARVEVVRGFVGFGYHRPRRRGSSLVLEGPLISFAEGVWLSSAPVRFLGLQLTSTMTVLRLPDGSLLLHSPVAITGELRAAVEALGRVGHLYAPNLFHHLRLGEWSAAFPSARVHAPPGLARKRRDLRIDRVHGDAPEPAFDGSVAEVIIQGFRLRETVLFYRAARTLVVADLVSNVGRPSHPWTRLYTRTMGFYDRVALSRMIRWTAFSDRVAARTSLEAMLALPFDRVVVGHGPPLDSNGRDAIARAYAWLLAPT